MNYFKINAFIPVLSLPSVEEALKLINVPGITVSEVKGYGEHMNFYSSDWLEIHGRVEIFCQQDEVDNICKAIKRGVGMEEMAKGFIAIMPVDNMFSLSSVKDV